MRSVSLRARLPRKSTLFEPASMYLAFKYAAFAATATLINIISQDLAIRVYTGILSLYVSIGFGTFTGLLTKYVLDKKYIFSFYTRGVLEDGKKFFLYCFMGIFTTIIFWGTELAFEFIFANKGMRYLGGVIGLCIGYWIKYNLDKRFVFVRRPQLSVDEGLSRTSHPHVIL